MGTREVSLSELALCLGDFGRRLVPRQFVDSPAGVVFGITNGVFPKIGGFPAKSSMFIGFSIINHPFWGTPILGNTQLKITN